MTTAARIVFLALAVTALAGPTRAADSVAAYAGYTGLVIPDGRVLLHDGSWSASAADRNGDGGVDRVEIDFTPSGSFAREFVFATGEPGRNLAVGTYRIARPYERTGKNLLLFSLFQTPCPPSFDTQEAFTVLAADFDTSGPTPVVRSFAARFAVACPNEGGPIYGYVAYNSEDLPEIASAEYASSTRTLTLRGPNIALADRILIDDLPFEAKRTSDGALVARKARLQNGDHVVRIAVTASGYTSPEFSLFVGPTQAPPFSKSRLKINSDPGNFVGGNGGVYRFVKGAFHFSFADYLDDDQIDAVSVRYTSADSGSRSSLDLAPANAGRNFAVGFYPDATGHPVIEGHPGLNISIDGRECQEQAGFFTVTDFAVERANGIDELRWLRATFDMRCMGTSPPLHGILELLAPPIPAIDRVVYQRSTREIRIEGRNMSAKLKIFVDGQAFDPSSAASTALVLERFDLLPGVHAVYVATDFPVVSSRPIIVRG